MFIILNWLCGDISNACIVVNEDGENMTFNSYLDAEKWAEAELNGEYKIISE